MELLKEQWLEQADIKMNMDCWQSMQCLDEELYDNWLEKLYAKGKSPDQAAEIIERAWRIYLLNK